MNTPRHVDCHIGFAPVRASAKSDLRSGAVIQALIQFALPDMGILFRCRDNGTPFDLEVTALCTALQYITTELTHPPEQIRLFTSAPELVFALTRPDLAESKFSSEQRAFISEIRNRVKLTVKFVERDCNRSFCPAIDFPALPIQKPDPGKSGSRHDGGAVAVNRAFPKSLS